MRLAPPPLEIGERDGFKGTDLFGYKEFGEKLAGFVESLEGPSVIGLDGPWGSGKTTFGKQWAGLLRQRGSAVIYFDAFAADSGDDPLGDIASQLFVGVADEETRRRFADAALQLMKSLAPVGAGLALRWATSGFVGEGPVRSFISAFRDAWRARVGKDDEMSKVFRRRIDGAQDRARVISDFRKALESLADAMKEEALGKADSAEKGKESSLPRPLVIIIDELDRCKPTYALDLLENLKHVFNVENVCFVLVTNSAQLEKVVESQYGVTAATAYLKKFFQASFFLPKTGTQTINSTYIQYLLDERWGLGHLDLKELVETVVSRFGVDLRGMERVALHVGWCLRRDWFSDNGFLRSVNTDGYEDVLVPVVVGVVRALDANMYSRLRRDEVSFEELTKFLKLNAWEENEITNALRADILQCAFPPKEIVGKGGKEMDRWKTEQGQLHHRVQEACGWLEVVQEPSPF